MSIKEQEKPILTVIMPVYNTGRYLKECLDSLINQTLKEIEIICVNDASTDNSYEVLMEYAQKDDRIKIINNEINAGQSVCRNTAMNYINGKYTVFMDSDDKIELDAYEKLYDFAEKYNDDIVVYDALRFNNYGKVWPSILHSKAISGEIVYNSSILEHKELVYDTLSWDKFIKSDFLKELNPKFIEGLLYQDIPFSMELFLNAKSIGIYPEPKYYWRVRGGSVTNKIDRERNISNRIFVTNKVFELLEAKEEYKPLLNVLYHKLAEIDFLQFINEIDTGNEEFRRILIEEYTPRIKEFPQEAFEMLDDIDKLKYKLLLEDKIDELISLVSHDNLFKANKKELNKAKNNLKKEEDKNKKLTDENKNLSDKNKKLSDENKKLKEEKKALNDDIKRLKAKNKKMKNEMKDVKSTKGWFKYKTNNIYDRTINKREK